MTQPLVLLINEVLLAVLAFLVIGIGMVSTRRTDGRREMIAAAVGLAILLAHSFMLETGSTMGGVCVVTPVAIVFKRIFLMAGFFMVLLSWPRNYTDQILPREHTGEYLGLMLLSLTGMCLLVSSHEIITLYVSLELVTLPLVLLVAFNRTELRSNEAAIKYVFFSALASGLLLYGLSLVYGMTGTTRLEALAGRISPGPLSALALIMITAGVGFKISAVPFHLWTPDTYEGAPLPVTAFLSVASKSAGFVLFYQLIVGIFGQMQEALQMLVIIMSIATMTLGNLIALHQTNMKRFLAYSSIAQAGYILIGLTNTSATGTTAVLFYLLVYLFSNIAAFAVVIFIASRTGKEDMRDYLGLSETNPALALVMMLAMFSLAGIPPLAGFLGKFYLFAAAAEIKLYSLVLIGAVNATLSLFYYLLVIKYMYLRKPEGDQKRIETIPLSAPQWIVLATSTTAMITIGLLPQVINWISSAAAVK